MRKILLPLLVFGAVCIRVDARTVSGSVFCGKEKLSGVIVTDGTNFTQTARNGKFTFDIEDDAAFVYIVTPSGYVADWSSGVPAFYQKADKDYYEFSLTATQKTDTYNILAVGDPQPREEEHFEELADIPLNDLASTASSLEGVTVGVALGDICYDRLHLQKRWKEEIPRTGIPFYPAVGNHDHDMNSRDPQDEDCINAYRENLGPENYAFCLAGDFVLVLDDIIYRKGKHYIEGYTEDVLDWVRGLMAYVPAEADIYVAQHSPLNGRNNRKMIVGHEVMLDLLKGHDVSFLSGHNHINGNFEYAERVREHNIAAICGTWWDAYHCTDGTPRGYKVFTKKDGHLSWYYKSISRDRDFQFEVFRPGECRINSESVVVNVWDYDPCWRVEWYEDGEYMGIMTQVYEYSPLHAAELEATYKPRGRKPSDYKRTRAAHHFFAERPSGKTRTFTVKVTDRFGNVFKETISLK